jgi:hypothetical protein
MHSCSLATSQTIAGWPPSGQAGKVKVHEWGEGGGSHALCVSEELEKLPCVLAPW